MDEKLQEALNQAAAESLRADEAEKTVQTQTERADVAEGELRAMTTSHDALLKERADSPDADKLQRQLDASQRLFSAEKARADAAEDPENIRKLVKARVALEARSAIVLGEEMRLDDLSDREVMVAVIERLDGAVEDDASEAYVSGCFNTLVKGHVAGAAAIQRVQEIVQTRTDDNETRRADNRSAREKFLEQQNSLASQEVK